MVIDIRRSQDCDLDELLKINLFFVLKDDSQEKKGLIDYQESIEKLERKLDADVQAKAVERNKEKTVDPTLETESSDQGDPEIAQWKNELDILVTRRQKILDRFLDECLEQMLPICEDTELRRHLTE